MENIHIVSSERVQPASEKKYVQTIQLLTQNLICLNEPFRLVFVASTAAVNEFEKRPERIKHCEFNQRPKSIKNHGFYDYIAYWIEPFFAEVRKFAVKKTKIEPLLSQVCINKQNQESCVKKLHGKTQSCCSFYKRCLGSEPNFFNQPQG